MDSDQNDHIKATMLTPKGQIFFSSPRLSIMLIVFTHKSVFVTELQKGLKLTPGNLDYHLQILENAGYINKKPRIFLGRFQNVVEITKKGKQDFKQYVYELRDLLKEIDNV
jgi:DNA-binding MarR family transcriptional regulator